MDCKDSSFKHRFQRAESCTRRKQKAGRYTKVCHTAKTTAVTGSSFEIYQKLQEQNKAIFALEKQRSDLEIELSDSKGIFKAKRRSELSTEIAGLEERISRMKVRLSHIVKEYGYQNVEAFYKAFHKAETAYGDYQDILKNWEQRYGEKPQSLHDRLKSKKQDIRERELTRPYSPANRGRSR